MENIAPALLDWFYKNRRILPFREDPTPYHVWLSEVMLQQTRVSAVLPYYERFLAALPDIPALAACDEEKLHKLWEGLGYYSRVRNLQKAAKIVCEQYGGQLPADYAALRALPGIGDYTAGAIASISFGIPVPAVDGNVLRVFSRLYNDPGVITDPKVKKAFTAWVMEHQPPEKAGDYNQALMELGALVCVPNGAPLCDVCPLAGLCESRHLGIQNERPVPGKKAAVTQIEVVCGVLLHEGKVFIQRRNEKDVWGGLWEFPGGCVEPGETPEQAVVREWMEEVGFKVAIVRPLDVIRHNYTTYRITLRCYQLRLEGEPKGCPVPEELTEATACQWIAPQDIEAFPLPAPHRKLADNCSLFDNPASGE